MPFQKGHDFGRFTADNQPGGETKSAGWKRRRIMRDILNHFLEHKLLTREDMETVRRFYPELGEDEITASVVIVAKLVTGAMEGDLAATKIILRILGED